MYPIYDLHGWGNGQDGSEPELIADMGRVELWCGLGLPVPFLSSGNPLSPYMPSKPLVSLILLAYNLSLKAKI